MTQPITTPTSAELAETGNDDLCPDPWHSSPTEPTEPCPACGDPAPHAIVIDPAAWARQAAAVQADADQLPVDPAQTRRTVLAVHLHRIADDIVRLDLPVGDHVSLGLGVLDSRAELQAWADHLGATITMGGYGVIPVVRCRVPLAGRYADLTIDAQILPDGRSEVERLRAEVEALRAQVGGER